MVACSRPMGVSSRYSSGNKTRKKTAMTSCGGATREESVREEGGFAGVDEGAGGNAGELAMAREGARAEAREGTRFPEARALPSGREDAK